MYPSVRLRRSPLNVFFSEDTKIVAISVGGNGSICWSTLDCKIMVAVEVNDAEDVVLVFDMSADFASIDCIVCGDKDIKFAASFAASTHKAGGGVLCSFKIPSPGDKHHDPGPGSDSDDDYDDWFCDVDDVDDDDEDIDGAEGGVKYKMAVTQFAVFVNAPLPIYSLRIVGGKISYTSGSVLSIIDDCDDAELSGEQSTTVINSTFASETLYTHAFGEGLVAFAGSSGHTHVFTSSGVQIARLSCNEKSQCYLNTTSVNWLEIFGQKGVIVGSYQGLRLWRDVGEKQVESGNVGTLM